MPLPAALGDRVWHDLSGDGIQDASEPGMANVTVHLLQNGAQIASTTTDANGSYGFTNLAPGVYQVMFVAPPLFVYSDADQGANDALDSDANTVTGMTGNITLVAGQTDLTIDAGLFQAVPANMASLGDRVWEDLDLDGIQDANEPGIANATVRLFNSADMLIASTTTDANGFYRFDNLAAGTYYLVFVTPAGYVISPRDQGGSDAADSDIDLNTGRTANIDLADGEVDLTWDAGLYRSSSLSGFVYCDADNDGVFDGNESPIAGVRITLTGIDHLGNAVMRMATTDAGGAYRFTDLRPGVYRVDETQPGNFLDGKDTVGSVGGTLANDRLSDINLGAGGNGINYNFGERARPGMVNKALLLGAIARRRRR
jgi:protocatechuate 3,4-dioxygenase beta subunit